MHCSRLLWTRIASLGWTWVLETSSASRFVLLHTPTVSANSAPCIMSISIPQELTDRNVDAENFSKQALQLRSDHLWDVCILLIPASRAASFFCYCLFGFLKNKPSLLGCRSFKSRENVPTCASSGNEIELSPPEDSCPLKLKGK